MWAARQGHYATLALLIHYGADVNAEDRVSKVIILSVVPLPRDLIILFDLQFGDTALKWVIRKGDLKTMKLLLDNGTKANKYDYVCIYRISVCFGIN